MANILKIAQDAQDVVRLSTLAAETLHDLELDTITYTVKDKDGNQIASYEGRQNQELAHDAASLADELEPSNGPHYVEQQSNLSIDESGKLNFEVGSMVGVLFPTDEIKATTEKIKNAVDCEYIQQAINEEIMKIKDLILAKTSDIATCASKTGLMSLPSDPLKILSWAKKFVSQMLGPQLMAMIDLAIQLALFAQAIQEIIIAAQAAQQNVLLCAASIVDNTIDKVISEATDVVNQTLPQIDQTLSKINEVQNAISDITGATPVFNTTSVDLLIQSATAPAKARFMTSVNEFVAAPFEDAELTAETVSSVGSSLSGDSGFKAAISGDSTFASDTLASAGAVAAEQSFTVDGTTFTFTNGVLTAVA